MLGVAFISLALALLADDDHGDDPPTLRVWLPRDLSPEMRERIGDDIWCGHQGGWGDDPFFVLDPVRLLPLTARVIEFIEGRSVRDLADASDALRALVEAGFKVELHGRWDLERGESAQDWPARSLWHVRITDGECPSTFIAEPRTPSQVMSGESTSRPRVSMAPSEHGCIVGLSMWDLDLSGKTVCFYQNRNPVRGTTPSDFLVPDASVTGEVWVEHEVSLVLAYSQPGEQVAREMAPLLDLAVYTLNEGRSYYDVAWEVMEHLEEAGLGGEGGA